MLDNRISDHRGSATCPTTKSEILVSETNVAIDVKFPSPVFSEILK
jgi:hypothetical protein